MRIKLNKNSYKFDKIYLVEYGDYGNTIELRFGGNRQNQIDNHAP